MKYKIDINGMHCTGCEMLLKMSLEEVGFENAVVSMKNKQAFFTSTKSSALIKDTLDKIFSEFDKYKYSNLVNI